MPSAVEIIRKMQADQKQAVEQKRKTAIDRYPDLLQKFNTAVVESGIVEEMNKINVELLEERGQVIINPPKDPRKPREEDYTYQGSQNVLLEWPQFRSGGGQRFRVKASFNLDDEVIQISGERDSTSKNPPPIISRENWPSMISKQLAEAYLYPGIVHDSSPKGSTGYS